MIEEIVRRNMHTAISIAREAYLQAHPLDHVENSQQPSTFLTVMTALIFVALAADEIPTVKE